MSTRKYAIIIVDDDKSIRLTLSALLEREGYTVATAETAKEAMDKTNAEAFDLALVDMRLPDMMGVDLLGRLKDRTPKTAKIIVTGYPSQQNAIKAVNEGADGYLLKPVNGEVLLDAVRKHLKKRDEETRYSEQKVVNYLETRIEELAKAKRENRSSSSS